MLGHSIIMSGLPAVYYAEGMSFVIQVVGIWRKDGLCLPPC